MRILVVEDQDAIRTMLEALVSARGHEVVSVNNGARALEQAALSAPDLVLLDLHLPGQYDGLAVCKKLRAAEGTRTVPILMISAKDDPETRELAAATGATAYFGKPFSPLALLRQVDACDRSRRRRSPERPA
jgi:DNA-binding response OmpR family regulator